MSRVYGTNNKVNDSLRWSIHSGSSVVKLSVNKTLRQRCLSVGATSMPLAQHSANVEPAVCVD